MWVPSFPVLQDKPAPGWACHGLKLPLCQSRWIFPGVFHSLQCGYLCSSSLIFSMGWREIMSFIMVFSMDCRLWCLEHLISLIFLWPWCACVHVPPFFLPPPLLTPVQHFVLLNMLSQRHHQLGWWAWLYPACVKQLMGLLELSESSSCSSPDTLLCKPNTSVEKKVPDFFLFPRLSWSLLQIYNQFAVWETAR